jgi:hypothetical protein
MFEEYLQDAYSFFHSAQAASSSGNTREAQRYYRAAVFYASGAIEAFVNYIADSFAKAATLPPHEIAFLNDKTLYFSVSKGDLIERTEYHKIDDKLRLLIKRFIPTFNFQDPSWSKLMSFKEFRDSLVHPRVLEDETDLPSYKSKLSSGMTGIIQIMNVVSQGIFRKPLRKQILDLLPE